MAAAPSPIPTPNPPVHFDYRHAAAEAKLSASELASIVRMFEDDYPHDVMLRELHVLRACNAIVRGAITAKAILACKAASNDSQAA